MSPPTPKSQLKDPQIYKERSSCCDFVTLSVSFLFTIFIAWLMLVYVQTYHQQNQIEIEKFIERKIDERILHLKRNPHFYERKNDDGNENSRKKRTIVEFRPIG